MQVSRIGQIIERDDAALFSLHPLEYEIGANKSCPTSYEDDVA
jgi:hypothetical protein